MDVDSMEAGRELDTLVAERVMGWTRWDITGGEDCPCESGVTYFADWGDMGGVAVYTPPHLTGDVEFYFEPSRDIKDAWRVVETMKGVSVAKRADGRWMCWHWNRVHRSGAGETAPLAICRAALSCTAYLADLATPKAVSQETTPAEHSEAQG
jgi:hypothetical protein